MTTPAQVTDGFACSLLLMMAPAQTQTPDIVISSAGTSQPMTAAMVYRGAVMLGGPEFVISTALRMRRA